MKGEGPINVARARAHDQAAQRREAHGVSTDLPSRTAVIEQPLPKCAVIMREGRPASPASAIARFGDIAVAGAVEAVTANVVFLHSSRGKG